MTELTHGIDLHPGDCLDVLAALPADHFDACVCDPPYHLTTGKNGGAGEASLNLNSPAGRARISTGFMGTAWDGGDIAFRPDVWRAVLRVLKPGAHLLAMGGTRTYHRLACAIEDAGFEIRDQVAWCYGQGFPKSRNIGNGWGTALKPAWEPIVLARKPLSERTVAANVLKHGTGALNINGCRIGIDETERQLIDSRSGAGFNANVLGANMGRAGGVFKSHAGGRWPANLVHDGSDEVLAAFPDLGKSTGGRIGNAGGGAVENLPTGQFEKGDPGFGDTGSAARFFYQVKGDNLCLSTKYANDAPQLFALQSERVASVLSHAVERSTLRLVLESASYRAPDMSVSDQQLRLIVASVTEAIQNIERRFSLGLPHESITVKLGPATCAAIPNQIGITTITASLLMSGRSVEVATFDIIETSEEVGVPGFAKRLHYTAKADADDRLGSRHPTIKPVDLMQWLCRLVTPPGGLVLDPFAGTGTTGEAAFREGMRAVLIEREAEYQADIRRRMALMLVSTAERCRQAHKEKQTRQPLDNQGTLFE